MTADILPMPFLRDPSEMTMEEGWDLITAARRRLMMLEQQALEGVLSVDPEWIAERYESIRLGEAALKRPQNLD